MCYFTTYQQAYLWAATCGEAYPFTIKRVEDYPSAAPAGARYVVVFEYRAPFGC